MKITEINLNLKKVYAFAIGAVLLLVVFKALSIILMLLVSILLAYLMNPFVTFLERFKIPRFVGCIILMVLIAAVAFTILAFMLPMFLENVMLLIKNLPAYIKTLFGFIDKTLVRFNISIPLASTQNFFLERMGAISSYALSAVTTAAASFTGVVSFALNVIVVPLLVFLLLKDFAEVKLFMEKIKNRFKLQNFATHAGEFETIIGKYFRGMFLVGLILSVLYSLVLIIVGVNTSIFLGFITGMGVLIPYVGFGIGLTISLIMTAVQFQDVIHVVYVLIGFSIVQFLESFVITPKVVGESLGLNPVAVIIGLMIGGTLFGFFGMILALPITAFLKILMNKYVFKEK